MIFKPPFAFMNYIGLTEFVYIVFLQHGLRNVSAMFIPVLSGYFMLYVCVCVCVCGNREIYHPELANLICLHKPAIISSPAKNQYKHDREILLQIGAVAKHRKYNTVLRIGVVIIKDHGKYKGERRGEKEVGSSRENGNGVRS